jgi:hypothetical protein
VQSKSDTDGTMMVELHQNYKLLCIKEQYEESEKTPTE